MSLGDLYTIFTKLFPQKYDYEYVWNYNYNPEDTGNPLMYTFPLRKFDDEEETTFIDELPRRNIESHIKNLINMTTGNSFYDDLIKLEIKGEWLTAIFHTN